MDREVVHGVLFLKACLHLTFESGLMWHVCTNQCICMIYVSCTCLSLSLLLFFLFIQEAYIADLDAKSGASLKLTVLNPHGRIWTMVAGGGASVIYR